MEGDRREVHLVIDIAQLPVDEAVGQPTRLQDTLDDEGRGIGIVVQRLADLNGVVTKAKTMRIEKEALYNQLKAVQGTPAVDSA